MPTMFWALCRVLQLCGPWLLESYNLVYLTFI